MPLPAALLSSVSHNVRTRGAAYFAAGAVTAIDFVDGILSATVKGTDLYDVWIEPQGSLLRATCTCPYFFDQLLVCKHIWAVILAAESRKLVTFAHDDPAADIEPVDFDEDLDEPIGTTQPRVAHLPRGGKPLAPPPAPHRPAPAVWRRQLAGIAAATQPAHGFRPAPLSGSLLFVIDVGASNAANGIVVSVMSRDRKANGDWRTPRPARMPIAGIRALPPGPEREILERLLGGRPYYDWNPLYPDAGDIGQSRIDGALARDLLPAMCATGRCVVLLRQPTPTYLPLAWDDGPP
jgi:hypothetical protein